MDFLFVKNDPINIASIQQEDGGRREAFACYWRDGSRTHEKECENDE